MGFLISGNRKKNEEEDLHREHREETKESQRGRGKTRRLRLPVMTTARLRPSGEMAKSRKVRLCRMGMGVGWAMGIS